MNIQCDHISDAISLMKISHQQKCTTKTL